MAKLISGRIGVLMGGFSTEREISLKSGKAVLESLKGLGLDVVALDIKTKSPLDNTRLIKDSNIGIAFIALHGSFGEDGQIQQLLEEIGIPYTGSGIMASRLAMDKIASRRIFQIHSLTVPRYKILYRLNYCKHSLLDNGFKFPVVIKPASHGSSIGLSIIDGNKGLEKAIELAFSLDEYILMEEYIKGREITVGILRNTALPVIEIKPKSRFFDYRAKYTAGQTNYIIPAKIKDFITRKARYHALLAHRYLECEGFSRVDMILKDNHPYILEVNTIPGLTKISLLPKAAKLAGLSFDRLCLCLLELAYAKNKNKNSV